MEAEIREQIIQAKNNCTSAVLMCLETQSALLELEFEQYNKIRNLIRYENNRLINKILGLLGDPTHVRMTRSSSAKG